MQILELAAKLQSLGLSDKESKVYVATMFLGSGSVQKIAEQAGVNRPTTYVVLDQLAAMGLVSQSTEGKKTVFISEGAEAIETWLDTQERAIKAKRSELAVLRKDLNSVAREVVSSAPTVRFFRGQDFASMNGYLRRKAKPGSTIYSFTDMDALLAADPGIGSTNPPARLKKKLHSKLIYSYSKGTVPSSKTLLRETKKVAQPIAAEINLYDHGTDITVYDSDEPTAIIIESPAVTKALRQLFELAWKNVS